MLDALGASTSTPTALPPTGRRRLRPPSPTRSTSAPRSAGGTASCTRPSPRRPTTRPSRRSRSRRATWRAGPGEATRDVDPRPRHRQARPRLACAGEAEGRCGGAADGAEGDPRPRLGRGRPAGRGPQDARPRRLPSRPGAGRAGRRLHHRLRGRAARGLAERRREDLAAARRRRHAALLRLCRLVGARPAARPHRRAPTPALRDRAFALARRGGARLSSTPTGAAAEARASCRTRSSRQALLDLFLIQKAAYEVQYEAANRPAWLSHPASRGLLRR